MDTLKGFISIKIDSELIYSREKGIVNLNKNNINSHKSLGVEENYTHNSNTSKEE